MKKYYILSLMIFLTVHINAQDVKETSKSNADEIAKELSNPVGSLANFTFQGTYSQWGGSLAGVSSQNTSSLIFMPSLPFKIWGGNLSVRPSIPVAAAPTLDENGEWSKVRGLGDMGIMAMYGRMTEKGFLWGFGPTMFFPTATDPSIGKDQFQLGPVALAGVLKDWGVLGALWQHWWGINNDESVDKVNLGTLQLFYWFSAGNGWQIGGSPIQSANYVNGSDIDFSVPLNLGLAKTVIIGKMPLKFTVQGQYFATQPDLIGPNWGVFFQIVPVIKVPW